MTGNLVEGEIKTIFNGVSRQPHTVRLPGQVQESDNALHSVVTGGFEKRPASQHIATLAGASVGSNYAVHAIERDLTEQYIVLLPGDGTILVYDALTGAQKTVNAFSGTIATYITGSYSDFSFTSVADYTFIVNRTKITAMLAATTGTITGNKTAFADLPATGSVGDVYRITGAASALDDYYVTWNATTLKWVEAVNPNGQNSFDRTTMPHQLVRNNDGTFTLSQVAWLDRPVGDETTVKKPSFIGSALSDVYFHRNRLGVIGREFAYLGQSGDFFNLWPKKSTEVLDADPVDMAATMPNRVTNFRWAVPFRKTLFLTADKTQWELNAASKLTPNTAVLDPSTAYDCSAKCRPVTVGDELYFAASAQSQTVLWEYSYNYQTITNTADDVLKHAAGYVEGNPLQMATVTLHDRLFMLADAHADTLYVYTAYWDGEKKAQSAWGKYTFSGATVLGIATLTEYLYVVLKRGAAVHLERLTANTEAGDSDAAFPQLTIGSRTFRVPILLDRRTKLTGVYNAGTNTTTWTTPYAHANDVQIVLGAGFPTGKIGRQLAVSYPSSTTVAATGDFSAAPVFAGVPYTMSVELSRQYLRDQQGAAVITGRLQLRNMTLAFKDTGYFETQVTPEARSTKTSKMTGRVLGSSSFNVGAINIVEQGTFKFKVGSRADTTKIVISNPSYLPSIITSAAWVGFFNEVSRSG